MANNSTNINKMNNCSPQLIGRLKKRPRHMMLGQKPRYGCWKIICLGFIRNILIILTLQVRKYVPRSPLCNSPASVIYCLVLDNWKQTYSKCFCSQFNFQDGCHHMN